MMLARTCAAIRPCLPMVRPRMAFAHAALVPGDRTSPRKGRFHSMVKTVEK